MTQARLVGRSFFPGEVLTMWIGVDAHKRVHQAVAIGGDGEIGERTIDKYTEGWASLLAWAQQWPERLWAAVGSGSLGRGVAQFLAEHGQRVHEVSPKWTAQRRRTQRKPGKSDRLDALAVARLLREEATTLPLVLPDEEAVATVQLWNRLREDVVADMTRVRNRLHALLLLCDPTYKTHIPDPPKRSQSPQARYSHLGQPANALDCLLCAPHIRFRSKALEDRPRLFQLQDARVQVTQRGQHSGKL
jgi:transposase